MNWREKLKAANVNIHLVATGGGAGFQNELWGEPGSSAYLSGASFPYSPEEQEEFLGFMPEHFASEENAIDLASAAYMKAYKFGGKNPVGLSVTASVASEKEHRGDHRVYTCLMTNDKVITTHHTMVKGVGTCQRSKDGYDCDSLAFFTLLDGLDIAQCSTTGKPDYKDATQLATDRFFLRPYFESTGKRFAKVPVNFDYAIYPGAFNPPHEGHFGVAEAVRQDYFRETVFEITARPPHKDPLTVQQCLQRAKLLRCNNRIFTVANPYYIDKARANPGVPLILGADAMVRMLDPKWGLDTKAMLQEFYELGTDLYIAGREVNGKWMTMADISNSMIFKDQREMFLRIARPISGEWNISSTEIRNKLL